VCGDMTYRTERDWNVSGGALWWERNVYGDDKSAGQWESSQYLNALQRTGDADLRF